MLPNSLRAVRGLPHSWAQVSEVTRRSQVWEVHRFVCQAQVSPPGLRFHGGDLVTWQHLGVREAGKCHHEGALLGASRGKRCLD